MSTETSRRLGANSYQRALNNLLKPAFTKRGFAHHRSITDWSKIVGEEVARFVFPKKLTFPKDQQQGGTLYLEVYDSGVAMELVYLKSQIIERIATFFGFKAVGDIKVTQSVSRGMIAALHEGSGEGGWKMESLPAKIEGIDDPALSEVLGRLAGWIQSENGSEKGKTAID
jgi:hypothetical protein